MGRGAGTGASRRRRPQPSFGTVQRRYEQPLGSLLLLTNEVFPGFSGAPAVNARGEMVGLVVGRLADGAADWARERGESGARSFALAGG